MTALISGLSVARSGAGLLRAFDAEGFADRFIIVRAGFDLFRERTKTLKAMGLIRARFLMRQR